MGKNIKKLGKIVIKFITTILILVMGLTVVNQIMYRVEAKKYLPIGKMVTVEGNQMHVCVAGTGNETIVLLSGLGTSAPLMDFMPLIKELEKNYKVAVVENFGYGFSETTDRERTVENIVEETREALSLAGVPGPYILMPHSISGIYTMYYASRYPDEVSGIVGIDCSMPNQVNYYGGEYPHVPKVQSLLAPMGLVRVATWIIPKTFLPVAEEGVYSKEVLDRIKVLTVKNTSNKNILDEINHIESNCSKTIKMQYAKNLPVLMFTRKASNASEFNDRPFIYEDYLNHLEHSKMVILKGNHYLHWENSKKIKDHLDLFLKELD